MASKLTKPVEREIGSYIVTLTEHGLEPREKGRRLTVGPFSYGLLYQQGVQQASGLAPLAPRKRRKNGVSVSRGLLSTGDGK